MSDIAIRAEKLSKQYRIGGRREKYKTLRDTVTDAVTAPFRRAARLLRGQATGAAELDETIWALKDVSFEVKQGEVVGIIGANGAGKSTLLKVLSRITEPTSGYAEIYGRVGSLLEVGTGFHPELTGRENIALNGAILGMSRAEIERKFDEIVAFAEVERFIDTPVKHYSSGMYLRLAFAVAAHLEPEILLIDEVLAVGDVAFQRKCLGKMGEVASQGRTVLFVSHNMGAIRRLCQRTIVLSGGRIIYDGDNDTAIDTYLGAHEAALTMALQDIRDVKNREGIGGGRITRIGLFNERGELTTTFGVGKPLTVWFEIELYEDKPSLNAGVEVRAQNGTPMLNIRSDVQDFVFGPHKAGDKVQIEVTIPSLPFFPGVYSIDPWFGHNLGKRVDYVHEAIHFTLEPRGLFRAERILQPGKGMVIMDSEWGFSRHDVPAEPEAVEEVRPA